MEATMNARKLPQTDSIQELAGFWDAHDLTDFEDQLEEVREPVFEPDSVIPLHLHSTEAQAVTRIAEAKGLAAAELVRQWILEKIRAN
jgi:hypothetical protein